VFVVSGGTGSCGEQLAQTALAQFEGADVPITVMPGVRTKADMVEVLETVRQSDALVFHTLVDPALRDVITQAASVRGIVEVDLMGPTLDHLSSLLDMQPLGTPGLYRRVREEYFRKIEAIEFAVRHDDGRFPDELDGAEIIVTGVSRAGKTPLSMYLAVRGFKVANVPLVKGIAPPDSLFRVPRGRVVGLLIEPERLVAYRRQRLRGLGSGALPAYSDPREVFEDLEEARETYRKGRFMTVDVTSKSIEESANEVVALVSRHAGLETVSRTAF
jgi:hypothetical protein